MLPGLAVAYPPQASLTVVAKDGGKIVHLSADAGPGSFIMHNDGKFTLTISSMSIFGDDAGVFSLDPSSVESVVGQSSRVVEVHLRPDAEGAHSARVVIESNDWRRRDSDLILCSGDETCDPPQPPPLPELPQRGCSSTLFLAPALATMLLLRRRRR